ncbi:hypothetical protein ACQ86N_35660 [Puia sp. P3]|uniref:hypothetical protein n=1 Tax=Puia sp. P3 TaxID=3423952 RepID=UPI003D66E307
MYSRRVLAQKYLHYYFTAANGKGHGVHSPFVYDFIIHVLNDRKRYADYEAIEGLRRRLRGDGTLLEVEDLGAGSAWKEARQRTVGDITRRAAKAPGLGQLLYRIARYYRPGVMLELGTSLGFSAAYLAAGGRGRPMAAGEWMVRRERKAGYGRWKVRGRWRRWRERIWLVWDWMWKCWRGILMGCCRGC